MFIDQSYFTGPLTIAQLGEKSVQDNLAYFINRFEPVIMEAALGYDFYQAFLAGLEVGSDETIDQRWLDLLNGVAFVNANGIKKKFSGFAGGDNSQTVIAAQRSDLFIYAGVTPGFSVGGASYVNPSLIGWNIDLELVGFGTLEPLVDWFFTNNGIALNPTGPIYHLTSFNERWVLHFNGKKVQNIQSGQQNLLSPLAGFIYFQYMDDIRTQATGVGMVKSVSENSVSANPTKKICLAYNDAVDQIRLFWEMMQADQQKAVKVYPEFDPVQVIGYYYGFYNRWQYWFNYRGVELYSFRYTMFGL